jgi:hypothetical protein
MFFNIDVDNGSVIRGWLAPDNPSATPRILVRAQGYNDFEIEATIQRNDVLNLGVHSTGMVGFEVNETIIPELAKIENIEFFESESRTPIFRRYLPGRHIERNLFLFDCSVRPLEPVLAAARSKFVLNYPASERYAFETMLVILNNKSAKSIFVTGRTSYVRYAHYLENANFTSVALLGDPFEELAQRLLLLNLIQKSDASHLVSLFFSGIAPLADFARDLPLDDNKALLQRFRQATDAQREALASPMTRMFGCGVNENPERRHVATALENLASMNLVGVRGQFPAFASLLAGIIGVDIIGDFDPVAHPTIRTLADRLSGISLVSDLLEDDIALYSFAQESVNAALNDQGDAIARDTQTI